MTTRRWLPAAPPCLALAAGLFLGCKPLTSPTVDLTTASLTAGGEPIAPSYRPPDHLIPGVPYVQGQARPDLLRAPTGQLRSALATSRVRDHADLAYRGHDPVVVGVRDPFQRLREFWFIGHGDTRSSRLQGFRVHAGAGCLESFEGGQIGIKYAQPTGDGAPEVLWAAEFDQSCDAVFDLANLDELYQPANGTHFTLFVYQAVGAKRPASISLAIPLTSMVVRGQSGTEYSVSAPDPVHRFTVIVRAARD